jgi:sugar phosphate isomerase/epimerase
MMKIAKLGFEAIQVSGVGSIIPAEEIAETSQAYGLDVILTHTDPARILEQTKEVIEEHRMMKAKYIGIGEIPKRYERSQSGYREFITDFIPAAREIKNAGLQLMYHNHHIEFEKYDGKLAIEYMKDKFKDVNFTLDIYWVQMAGGDPAKWIRTLGDRVKILHLKDCAVVGGISRMCEVMEGNLNWQNIMDAAQEVGVKYGFIEQDECYGKDPFECLRISLQNLRNNFSRYEKKNPEDYN